MNKRDVFLFCERENHTPSRNEQKKILSSLLLRASLSFLLTIGLAASVIFIINRFNSNKLIPTPSELTELKAKIPILPTRKPAVSGKFYPGNSLILKSQLGNYFKQAEKIAAVGKPRILIVPHAGIKYSGQVAAEGFKQLERHKYSKVILLGASHNTSHNHVAVYSKGAWETPLGVVEIDKDFAKNLLSKEQNIIHDENPHKDEHSLEVELIFLQEILAGFKIVPILVSSTTEELIESIAYKIAYLMDDETLLVVSTDLSHYPAYETANKVDAQTINSILNGKKSVFEETIKQLRSKKHEGIVTYACGREAIKIGLRVAELLEITDFKKVTYQNSGGITNKETDVVGYTAIGAWKDVLSSPKLDEKAQKEALEIARETLDKHLQNNKTPEIQPQNAVLYQPLGAFVTLKNNNVLRGCIGEFEPKDPLYKIIQSRAIAAATKDTRFAPVSTEELPNIHIEISVLTPRKQINDWNQIVLGKHGVYIKKGFKTGTFLPQVAIDMNWTKEEFLAELCAQKAKLPKECFKDPNVEIYVYEVQIIEE